MKVHLQDDEAGIFMERDHDGGSRTPDYAGPGFKGHAGQPAFALMPMQSIEAPLMSHS